MEQIIAAIGGLAILVVVNKKITERLVKWFAFLQGDLITAASILVGWGLAWLFQVDPANAIAEAVGKPLRPIAEVWLYLIAGVVMSFGAGYLTDREEIRFGAVQVPGHGVAAAQPVVVEVDGTGNPL